MTSHTFSPPPLDGSLMIPDIHDYHLVHNPKHPFYVFAAENGSVQTISWEKTVQAIYRASLLVEREQQYGKQTIQKTDVIAIFANADTVPYFALVAGIIRAGHQVFPICTSFSDVALAHLLVQTNAKSLFVSGDISTQTVAKSACERLVNTGGSPCTIVPFPTFESLFNDVDPILTPPPMPKLSGNMTAAITHSSGSTGLPKPIRITHLELLNRACSPSYGEKRLAGQVLWYSVKPIYAWAFIVHYCWPAATGAVISVFQPSDPPVSSTPGRIVNGAVATKTDALLTGPRILKPLLDNATHLAALRSLPAVICCGGPLSKDVGAALIKEGVSLITHYGTTELGHVSTFATERHRDEDWEYFKISSHCHPVFSKQEGSEDLYRISFVNSPSHTPVVLNTKIADGSDAYDPGDLFSRHPDDPELWKVHGRADDQIITSNGQNINSYPIEEMLCTSPMVSRAVVFGTGQLHIGALLEPTDPSVDHLEFLKGISANIKDMNDFVPTYSRIFDGMVIVADPLRPFLCTQKGNTRRSLVLDIYKKEIDEAYENFEKTAESSGTTVYSIVYAHRHRA